MSPVEREILERFEKGDAGAMDLLYDNYSEALYGIAYRMLGDEEKAQDVLQEAFVKIWQRSRHYDPAKGRLFTWLLTIVRNQAIDAIRKRNRQSEIQGPAGDVLLNNIDAESIDLGVNHDIQKVLGLLDGQHRELIEHSYILGYTHPEIAEKFDMPLGTVKTRIRLAMCELRNIFENGR